MNSLLALPTPDLGIVVFVVFVSLLLLVGHRHGIADEHLRAGLGQSVMLVLAGVFLPTVILLFASPSSFESVMESAMSGGSFLARLVGVVSKGLILFGLWKLVATCLQVRPGAGSTDRS
ncbi:MAG: hypothetical protein R3F30_05130 [Planctomycetota bacterium]